MNPGLLNRKAEGVFSWSCRYWRRWSILGFTFALISPSTTQADVTLDGTMGPRGTLPGPNFRIGAEVGKRAGHNLFHSFGRFNVNTGESATFTGPAAVDNVISRVTGSSRSLINGPLRSEIQSANLWFINPNGVLFGKNASLDVDGSFHVSTADYLKLKDGVRFNAKPSANDALLTTAPPEAFGFLGRDPAPVTFTESRLSAREGKTLSVVGGDIKLTGGALSAPGGRINIASVDAAGEVAVGKTDLDASGFERRGNIRVSDFGTIDTSGKAGGAIFIRGGEFVVDGGLILAETLGNEDGVGINVKTDSLSVTGGALNATTFGSGKGGDLTVQADSILLSGFVCLFGISCQSVGANTVSTGDAGNLSIKASSLEVRDGAVVDASTFGSGHGGDLRVEADRIFLSGGGLGLFTGIAADSFSTGDAGDLMVRADSLDVRDGAALGSGTFGAGRSGNVDVQAERLLLDGEGTSGFTGITTETQNEGTAGNLQVRADVLTVRNGAGIRAEALRNGRGGDVKVEARKLTVHNRGIINASTRSTGHAGNVDIKARELTVRDVGAISSSTFGAGDAGNVAVEAERMVLDGKGTPGFTAGIFARTLGDGAGGNVSVQAGTVTVRGGALISASTFGAGRGGNVTVEAQQISLDGNEAPLVDGVQQITGITAVSIGTGPSGSVSITAHDTFRLLNGGRVTVETAQADAGDIDIHVGDLLHLRDGSSITTSAAVVNNEGTGNGGNITIDPTFVVLDGGSKIVAQAKRGSGGNINITADFLFQSPDSVIDASSEFGQSGTVSINSPDTNILGGITMLPETFLDAAALMKQHCAARAAGGRSSLVLRGGGVMAEPGVSPLPAYYMDVSEGTRTPSGGIENGAARTLDFFPLVENSGGLQWGCGSK